jgi:hypothetical protein
MPTASRFTTRYLPAEDRVQLMLELSDEEVQVLWLTRRLLNRMLPHLIRILDENAPSVVSAARAAAAGREKTSGPPKEALQRFSQEAAVSAIERQPAVGAGGHRPEGNISYLVTSVDVNTGPKNLRLDFKSGEEVLHSLPFGENALRQWLSILHSQYRAAGWEEPFWPSWIRAEGTEGAPKEDLRLN